MAISLPLRQTVIASTSIIGTAASLVLIQLTNFPLHTPLPLPHIQPRPSLSLPAISFPLSPPDPPSSSSSGNTSSLYQTLQTRTANDPHPPARPIISAVTRRSPLRQPNIATPCARLQSTALLRRHFEIEIVQPRSRS